MGFLVARNGNQEIIINDDGLDLSNMFDPDPATPVANPATYVTAGAVEITNSNSPTTLLDAGVAGSVLTIPLNTWLVGETYRGIAGGKWGSKAILAGKLKWSLLLGSEMTAAFEPTLPDGQVDAAWHMEWSFTRRSTGGAGVVCGQVRFFADVLGGPYFANFPALTLPSDANKTWDLQGDFATADVANKVSQQYFLIEKTGAPVP